MLQESVYCKLALNQSVVESVTKAVKMNSPSEGLVQMIVVTEKQYSRMEYVIGENTSTVVDSDERLVVL